MLGGEDLKYSFTFGFLVTSPDGAALAPDSLESTVGRLMDGMLDQESEAVFDSAVGVTLTEGQVELDVSVRASSEHEAAAVARDFIGAAIAGVGGTAVGPFAFAGGQPGRGKHTWHERRVELSIA